MMMMTIGKDDKKQMFPKEVKVLPQIKYKIKLKIIPQKYILMTFHGLLILFTDWVAHQANILCNANFSEKDLVKHIWSCIVSLGLLYSGLCTLLSMLLIRLTRYFPEQKIVHSGIRTFFINQCAKPILWSPFKYFQLGFFSLHSSSIIFSIKFVENL